MKPLRLMIVALLAALAFDSSSARSKKEQTQTQEQKAAPDQRGTDQLPFVVQPLPTKKTAEITQKEKGEADEKANSDWWTWFLGVLTIAALFGQLIVFIAQAYFLKGTLKATAEAAKAAQKQGNILAAVEGPLPLVGAIKLAQYTQIPGEVIAVDPVPGGSIPANCRILLGVENKGRTPLRLIELCIEKFSGAALPTHPVYKHVEPWGLVLEKGPLWIRPTDALAFVTPADVGAAMAVYPNGAFWVFGYFAYLNLMDERIEHKFLARWDLGQGFVSDNRPGYT